MDDPLIDAMTGGVVTPDDVDDVRRHLAMLRSLVEEVRSSWPSLVPEAPGRWRSDAAGGYSARLEQLRTALAVSAAALSEAEAALEARLGELERRLQEQASTLPTPAGWR